MSKKSNDKIMDFEEETFQIENDMIDYNSAFKPALFSINKKISKKKLIIIVLILLFLFLILLYFL